MKMNKLLSAVVGAGLMVSGTATASFITVGGVTWNPDGGSSSTSIDFTSTGGFSQYYVAGSGRGTIAVGDKIDDFTQVITGDILQGYGEIDKLNGFGGFCDTCELAFSFTGFKLEDLSTGRFSGGTTNVNVIPDASLSAQIYGNDWEITNYVEANLGDEWLTMEAVLLGPVGVGSTLDVTGGITGGTAGFAALNVTGGLAEDNFVIDTVKVAEGSSFEQFVDLRFDSSTSAGAPSGSATLSGQTIPEPTTLALLGLGLLGFGAAKRRKA